jgi:hypothetical protein
MVVKDGVLSRIHPKKRGIELLLESGTLEREMVPSYMSSLKYKAKDLKHTNCRSTIQERNQMGFFTICRCNGLAQL